MMEKDIRIRDRHQFELKLNYPFRPGNVAATYDLACYIFIPHNLGINRESYSKADFYNDLQVHIRFKTPSIPLTGITGADATPMARLKASAECLSGTAVPAAASQFEYQIKIFCCILISSLAKFITFIGRISDRVDRDRLIADYIQAVAEITNDFREVRTHLVSPDVPAGVLSIYSFADEYVSLLVERHYFDLLQLLRSANAERPEESWRKLIESAAGEVRYRQVRQYPSIPDDHSDNENLIFRRNVLKKFMGNVLFLDTRTRHEGRMLEQTLFGIAAGISMLFATLVLFLSQWMYGPLTLPVFLALVVGYMFKDRIKELLRVFFSRKMSSVLFDHKMHLYTDTGQSVGQCREGFDFVDESKIPERIMKIRDRDHITEIESDWLVENVVRYSKRIKLSSKAISGLHRDFEMNGIKDIIRFNVTKFTQQMGEPSKELFILDEDDYRRIKAERVYHLNMVLSYESANKVSYKRFRIVLNRQKIKRIETVLVEE
jgi:hypothetical protein